MSLSPKDQQHSTVNALVDKNADSSTLLFGATSQWAQLAQIHKLTEQYKDHRKPWIFVLGADEVINKIFPKIEEKLWVESTHAFWLNAQGAVPIGGWAMLRGNGKRPAEGIVCVGNSTSDRFAESLQKLFSGLNWLLPVNRVYLEQEAAGYEQSALVHVLDNNSSTQKIQADLEAFAGRLKAMGTVAIEDNTANRFAAELSKTLERDSEVLSASVAADKHALGKLDTIGRMSFIRIDNLEAAPDLIFQSFDASRVFGKGKKLKYTRSEKWGWGLSALALAVAGVFAYAANQSQQSMVNLQSGLQQLQGDRLAVTDVSKLVALQNKITDMEQQQAGFGGKLVHVLGYDHSKVLLATACQQYGKAAKQILVQPSIASWSEHLNQLDNLSDKELAVLSEEGNRYYDNLKAYLMLTERTDKLESDFLSKEMVTALTSQQTSAADIKSAVAFFIRHLKQEKGWAAQPDTALVESSRQALTVWMSEGQTEERIYNRIIQEAKSKYPDVTLAKLLERDTSGIWNVGKTLPGIYTLKSWNEFVKPQFANAAKQDNSDDWVLANNIQSQPVNKAVIASLRTRYFNEYADAWFKLLNSITWVERSKASDAASQMATYTDPKRSPLIGLFEAIKANGTQEGKQVIVNIDETDTEIKTVESLPVKGKQAANTVVEKREDKTKETQEQVTKYIEGPLQAKFETLLQLVDSNVNPKSDLTLQRYLEKITAAKQRLIQISGSSDSGAAARMMMQKAASGEDNEFTDGLQYARLLEVGIGSDLAFFARNVFVLPFATSWDSISGNAKHNLNAMWAQTLSSSLNSDFGGRYPFSQSETEVSIPMLAKYFEPEQGVLDQFIKTQLAGVLIKQGNQWVVAPGQDVKVNQNFLNQVNKISAVANDMFINGNNGYTFEIKPAATPGIIQYNLALDGQSLDYFNQEAEWKSFKWPGEMSNAGARITWEAEDAGLRQTREYDGRFGFIRLLENARVTPVDRSTYLIESPVAKGQTVRFYMRTNSGKGPLGVLDLRNIQLPAQVFEGK